MIPPAAPQTLRVVSYNIRKALGTDRRRDPERIMRIIRNMHADVVILQEADRRRAPRPSALPLERVQAATGLRPVPTPSDVSIGWHGNAILVRPSTRIDHVAHLTLPGVEPRGAMVADLHLGARQIRVVASHLGLLRPSRKEQLSAMLAHLDACDACPTLIAGDLNEWSQKVGLGRLAKRFTVHAPGKSYHARLPVAFLDRIALDQHLQVRQGGVVETAQTRQASDHLPIWLDVAHR